MSISPLTLTPSDPPPPFPSDIPPRFISFTDHHGVRNEKSDVCPPSSPFPLPVLIELSHLFAQLDTLSLGTLAYHQVVPCIDLCLNHLKSVYLTHPIPSQMELDQVLFSHAPDLVHVREDQRITFEQVHQVLSTCVVFPTPPPPLPPPPLPPPTSSSSFSSPSRPHPPPLSQPSPCPASPSNTTATPPPHLAVPILPARPTASFPSKAHVHPRAPCHQRRAYFLAGVLSAHGVVMVGMVVWQRDWAWFRGNPLLGPTPRTLVTWGGTYLPCMRTVVGAAEVAVLEKVCGWNRFLTGKPDQVFRLVSSLVVPSGVISLLITIGVAVFLGIPLEKKWGWKSMALIYMLSGFSGLVYSSIFSPYSVKTGLLASVSGIFGLFHVHLWLYPSPFLPSKATWQCLCRAWMCVFFFGAVFSLDKVHAITGFLSGCILSGSVFPFRPRWIRLIFALVWIAMIIVGLVTLFMLENALVCSWCEQIGNMASIEMLGVGAMTIEP